jgi:histidine triad (HIT) family protein
MSLELPPPSIRPARLGDAEGIGRVQAASRHATYRGIMSDAALALITVEERTRWWTRALESYNHDWFVFVVEASNQIVGFSCTGPAGLGAGSTVAKYDLYFLYLLPGWERRGFGRQLVERTFRDLRQRGIPDVQILCLRGTTAYLFYEALGGRLVEEGQHTDDDGTILPHRIYHYDLREEMQTLDCAFCAISRGDLPAVTVHSDEWVVAFMDKNPINPGHVLVIPRAHVEHIQDLPEEAYLCLMAVARRIAKAANLVYRPPKMGFAVAGFDVPHAHLHIVPLHDYDDLTSGKYLKAGRLHRAGESGADKPRSEDLAAEADKIRVSLRLPSK